MTAPTPTRPCPQCGAPRAWKRWGNNGDGLWVHYTTTLSIWCTDVPTDARPVVPGGDHKRPPEPELRPRVVAGMAARDERPDACEL